MKDYKDYSDFIILILTIIVFIILGFCFFLVFNEVNKCTNKGGIVIQGRCVKKEVLVNEK